MNQLQDDLAFLRAVVENSRRAMWVDVAPLLAWGLLTVGGVVISYLAPAFDSVWLWLVLIGLAWVFTGWRVLRLRGAGTPAGFAQQAVATLWFALFTTLTLIGFVGFFSGSLPGAAITPVAAGMFGIGYLTSGALMRYRWLYWLGTAWWTAAFALFLAPPGVRLALFGAAVLFLLVLPTSLLLRQSARG